jgi:CRP/FNR family cyclic AMP-dependent transcriptional regulator
MARKKKPTARGEVVRALGGVPLFSGLSDRELRTIAATAKEVSFPAGKTICREGDQAAGMHIVLEGDTKVQIGGRTRRKMGTGAYFGEVALVDGGPRSATVIAETDVRTVSIPAWNFKATLKENPTIALKLLDELAAWLREASSHIQA